MKGEKDTIEYPDDILRAWHKCPNCGRQLNYPLEPTDKSKIIELFNRTKAGQIDFINQIIFNGKLNGVGEVLLALEEMSAEWNYAEWPDSEAPIMFVRCTHCERIAEVLMFTKP